MAEKTTPEKLRILLPHWLEHNRSHQNEFRQWLDKTRDEGLITTAAFIEKALKSMQETDKALEEALEALGGPVEDKGHHH
ncbi:MAG: hypothetical protein ACQES8_09120 [Thermodesulfobacteriota bacterium]